MFKGVAAHHPFKLVFGRVSSSTCQCFNGIFWKADDLSATVLYSLKLQGKIVTNTSPDRACILKKRSDFCCVGGEANFIRKVGFLVCPNMIDTFVSFLEYT